MPAEGARIWVTRAQPQADATAARLRILGFEPVVSPMLEIWPITDAVIDMKGVDALAFTSVAGIAAFTALSRERDRSVFTVGDATAEAARGAGFTDVRAAGGDVQALAALIAGTTPRPSLVLNPTAAEPAADLPALLAERGVFARAAIVYETRETALGAPPAALDGVLIHSAKAAHAVARRLTGADLSSVTAYAISTAVAAPLAGLGWRRIAIAPFPNEPALLNLIQG